MTQATRHHAASGPVAGTSTAVWAAVRFPMITIEAPVGALRPGTTGNLPDDVRRVQYLFNKTPVASGAPATLFDTTSGVCEQGLIDAITAFQTFHSLPFVDGRVDIGWGTLSTLNTAADLSAFSAVREDGEFLSWLRRPRAWNFTLEDLLSLGADAFTSDPATSTWLPPLYQQNLFDTFRSVLDPTDITPGSWGVGPWDLYHCHVVVPKLDVTKKIGDPIDPALLLPLGEIKRIEGSIDQLRASARPDMMVGSPAFDAFDQALQPILAQLRPHLEALSASGHVSLLYHSFEISQRFNGDTRYAGFQAADARRNWLTPLGGAPSKFASADNPDHPEMDFIMSVELPFIVSKDGIVRVVAGTKEELVAVARVPFAELA